VVCAVLRAGRIRGAASQPTWKHGIWEGVPPCGRGGLGYGDLEDILSGVDHVIAMGVAQPDSLLLTGWSYGRLHDRVRSDPNRSLQGRKHGRGDLQPHQHDDHARHPRLHGRAHRSRGAAF
jgi:hypothetical protein